MLVTLGTQAVSLRHRAVTFQIPGNRFLLIKIYRKMSSKQALSLFLLSLSLFFLTARTIMTSKCRSSVYLLTGCEPTFPVFSVP